MAMLIITGCMQRGKGPVGKKWSGPPLFKDIMVCSKAAQYKKKWYISYKNKMKIYND